MFIIHCTEDLGITILDEPGEERLLSSSVTRQRSSDGSHSAPPLILFCTFLFLDLSLPSYRINNIRHNPARHTWSNSVQLFFAHSHTHLVSWLSSTILAYSTIIAASFLGPTSPLTGCFALACEWIGRPSTLVAFELLTSRTVSIPWAQHWQYVNTRH
jgi:hypothetical protein